MKKQFAALQNDIEDQKEEIKATRKNTLNLCSFFLFVCFVEIVSLKSFKKKKFVALFFFKIIGEKRDELLKQINELEAQIKK